MKKLLLVSILYCVSLQSAQLRKTQSCPFYKISEKELKATLGLLELRTAAQQRSSLNSSPLLRSLQALLAKSPKSTRITTATTVQPFTL